MLACPVGLRRLAIVVGGDLDEVAVGITEVDRRDGAGRSDPGNWSLLNLHVAGLQVGDQPVRWGRGDQTHINRSGCGSTGLGFQFVTRQVNVELVLAEPKGATASAEGDRLHAEHADIEVDGLLDVGDGKDQMVDPVDDDRCGWRSSRAHVATSQRRPLAARPAYQASAGAISVPGGEPSRLVPFPADRHRAPSAASPPMTHYEFDQFSGYLSLTELAVNNKINASTLS
jgi:hypothetical protein